MHSGLFWRLRIYSARGMLCARGVRNLTEKVAMSDPALVETQV